MGSWSRLLNNGGRLQTPEVNEVKNPSQKSAKTTVFWSLEYGRGVWWMLNHFDPTSIIKAQLHSFFGNSEAWYLKPSRVAK